MLTVNKTVNYHGGDSNTTGTIIKWKIADEKEELPKRFVTFETIIFRSDTDMTNGEAPVLAKEIDKYLRDVEITTQAQYEAMNPQKVHELVRDYIITKNPTWVAGDFVIDLTK